MDFKSSNTCKILSNRELLQNPISCNQLITDKLNRKTELLYKRDLISHYGCVNAIEFSNDGQYLVSGGDDRRVLLWNVQKALHNYDKPRVMCSQHHSNIFCLAFDNSVTHIYSAGNDDQVILHDMETGKVCDVFKLDNAVYGISVDPCNDNIFASAGEDGRILIFDIRLKPNSDPYILADSKSAFHAVKFNPVDPRLIVTANSKKGAALWDIRTAEKKLMQYGRKKNCMNVQFDQTGTQILALRRRRMPVLYQIHQSEPVVHFYHENYWNSCTMKSCCFAGLKDEFVLSGSDDFNLYTWKISDADSDTRKCDAHLVLKGHRSIVNQVRFDPFNCVIASSGVEKIVKIWSPLALPYSDTDSNYCGRKIYSPEEYMSLILRSGQIMNHDYSEESTAEDPQMMAFFDSLVRREQEGNASDIEESSDDNSSEENSLYNHSIGSFEDTDYSSLSDESPILSIGTPVDTASHNPTNVNSSPRSGDDDTAEHTTDEETAEKCKVPRPPINLFYDDEEENYSSPSGNNDDTKVMTDANGESNHKFKINEAPRHSINLFYDDESEKCSTCSEDKDNTKSTSDNEENIPKCSKIKSSPRHPVKVFYDTESSNDGDPSPKVTAPFPVASLLPSCSRSTSLSSSSSEENQSADPLFCKRKCKSRVKDSVHRSKRVRSNELQSSLLNTGDSVSEPGSSGTSELGSSSGSTSTDTVDSGVYLHSFPSIPKYKFTTFKRSEKRKYRSYRKASVSSSDTD